MHGESGWLDRFEEGLAKAEELIARFPAIGAPVRRDERIVLRRWSFPDDLPFIVLYVHRARSPIREAWLVRLFHFAQERTPLDPSDARW
jgi:hypothetical protein